MSFFYSADQNYTKLIAKTEITYKKIFFLISQIYREDYFIIVIVEIIV